MTAELKVGVAGLGTVGSALLRILIDRADDLAAATGRPLRVTAVSARNRSRDRGVDLSQVTWHDDPLALARDPDVDVVVELIGGAEGAARDTVTAALEGGKSVVTANKALLAAHGVELARLAEQSGAALNFEAAVAGGIPVVKALREALPGNALHGIFGILNGTCNYILTRMEEDKLGFAECLKEAQVLGYAEADPTFDIGGFDTAHKLAILTSLAFGTQVDADAVYVEGIASITPLDLQMADELGYRIKLLGVARRTPEGIEQRVHPTMVLKSSALAQVMGVTNAVAITGSAVGELTFVGPGAGGNATASSVVSDLADIARGTAVAPFGRHTERLATAERAPMQTHQGGYYIRMTALDRPGAAASIATRMAEEEISLESIIQRHPRARKGGEDVLAKDSSVPVVLITHATSEAAVRRALDKVIADGHIEGVPQLIRIETE